MQPDEVIFPSGSEYFVARGAAFCSMKNESLALSDICQKLKTLSMVPKDATNTGLPPLFQNETEIETFLQSHQKAKVNRRNLDAYTGAAFIGIDAGSTTTKIVLMSEQEELLYTFYQNNQGNPLQSVINGLKELYHQMP